MKEMVCGVRNYYALFFILTYISKSKTSLKIKIGIAIYNYESV